MKNVIRQKLADSLASEWPALTLRDARLPSIPNKVHAIVGMRRAGKSCYLKQCLMQKGRAGVPREALVYFSFEDERLAGMTADRLDLVLEEYYLAKPEFRDRRDVVFCFDEIQVVPNWELFIRRILDSERMQIFVSGSSARMLSREISTALRGRAVETVIYPFSFREYLRHHRLPIPENPSFVPKSQRSSIEKSFLDYLAGGGFPEAQGLAMRDKIALLQSYVDAVIFRDVVERHRVSNLEPLRRLVRQLLARPSGAFSVNKFANDLRSQGVPASKTLLHSMIAWLEDSFLLCSVPIYSASERKRQTNPRKVYPIDPGLIPAFDRSGEPNLGLALETAVLIELNRRSCEVAYVRTEAGSEIDFLATDVENRKSYIQVCSDISDPSVREREFRPLHEIRASKKMDSLLLLTLNAADTVLAQKTAPPGVSVRSAWEWLLDSEF